MTVAVGSAGVILMGSPSNKHRDKMTTLLAHCVVEFNHASCTPMEGVPGWEVMYTGVSPDATATASAAGGRRMGLNVELETNSPELKKNFREARSNRIPQNTLLTQSLDVGTENAKLWNVDGETTVAFGSAGVILMGSPSVKGGDMTTFLAHFVESFNQESCTPPEAAPRKVEVM
nr:hypothetical protein Iba_scaffold14647CG0340 [Ipomoea batatas]GME15139.1 hypothetical protein Iba_scaffold15946CG0030 [Ipomoea batatas]